jgi:hypothetical protein
MILNQSSMVNTLDNINEKFLSGESISPGEGLEAARWITSRQGVKGAYRSMFAPMPSDFEQGIRLFTGERLVSASARHIMGQEAARAVWMLGNQVDAVRDSYHRASDWMKNLPDFQQSGTFCCGRCTLAFWRHYWVGDFNDKEAQITKGLQEIKNLRLSDGKWHTLPFFYAIYTLLEIDLEPALDEIRYARPVMEKYVKNSHEDIYSLRRTSIITKALERIN